MPTPAGSYAGAQIDATAEPYSALVLTIILRASSIIFFSCMVQCAELLMRDASEPPHS